MNYNRTRGEPIYLGRIDLNPPRRFSGGVVYGFWGVLIVAVLAWAFVEIFLITTQPEAEQQSGGRLAPRTVPRHQEQPTALPEGAQMLVELSREQIHKGVCYCPGPPCDCPAGMPVIEAEPPAIRSMRLARR